MKPAPFDYTRPADLPGALEALAQDGARVLAGGQSLGPMLNLRLARPGLLVDLRRVEALLQLLRLAELVLLRLPGGGHRGGLLLEVGQLLLEPLQAVARGLVGLLLEGLALDLQLDDAPVEAVHFLGL